MPIKIAEISYLNSAPFYWNKKNENSSSKKFEWFPMTPRELGEKAKRGEIDAGPVSLVDSFTLEKEFEPLSNLGIAIENSAKSVLLFSKKPVSSLNGSTIGLISQSVTSLQLLKLVLEKRYGVKANYRDGLHAADDAQLLIGDDALKKLSKNGSRFILDLGEEWYQWQKLPFVFARWMVKKSLSTNIKLATLKLLEENLDSSRKRMKVAIGQYEKTSGWRYPFAQQYLKGFRYRLGKKEKKAISVFKELMEEARAKGKR